MQIKFIICTFLILVLTSCSAPDEENNIKKIEKTELPNHELIIEEMETPPPTYQNKYFILSDNIKLKTSFTSELEYFNFQVTDSTSPNEIQIQRFSYLDSEFGCGNPRLIDFNSDGVLDLLLDYGAGARAANQLFYLFIRDPESKQFRLVKGSANIPNLYFNPERKIIEGTYYYEGMSFVDFKIENDSMIKVAGVDSWGKNGWTFHENYQFDNAGMKTNLKLDSVMGNPGSLYSRK